MGEIERELLNDKPNCYIFDIDGCLANVRGHIILTNKETYKLYCKKYQEDIINYQRDLIDYEMQLRDYNRGKSDIEPIRPMKPELPVKPEEKKLNKIDWEYFKSHIMDAIPIKGVFDLFTSIALSHKVILLTGRIERHRTGTINWLKKVIVEEGGNDLYRRINFQLIMRDDNNENEDETTVSYKRKKVLELSRQYNIQLIIEDNKDIIKEYTKLGLLVLSPNEIVQKEKVDE